MGNSFSPHIQSALTVSFNPSLHDGLPSVHSHESQVSFSFFDSPNHVPSVGESSSSDSLSYFLLGPFPGGYSTSSSSNPFHLASQEVHSQEEECAAVLALALEEGLQGLFEGVWSGGSGGGSYGAAGSFSQGEVQFRAL